MRKHNPNQGLALPQTDVNNNLLELLIKLSWQVTCLCALYLILNDHFQMFSATQSWRFIVHNRNQNPNRLMVD